MSCAICEDGTAHCWGESSSPVTAGSGNDELIALRVPQLSNAVSIAVSGLRACVVTPTADVECWGQLDAAEASLSHGPIGPRRMALPSPAMSVAVGDLHACAVLRTNEVACWGANDHGQLGFESTQSALPPTIVPGVRALQIVAAGNATCAIDERHRPVCWGWNGSGLLGLGDQRPRMGPVVLSAIGHVDEIAMDGGRACTRGSNGTWCWGGDELAPATWRPARLPNLPAGRLAAVTGEELAIIDAEGALHVARNEDAAVVTSNLAPVLALSARSGSWCAILQSGSLRCWGRTFGGALVLQ